jgi:DNA-binding NtrC family response regulator
MLKNEQILIVDDDALMCKSLCAAIRRKGYEVDSANSGFEALEKLSACKFAIVITDIKMPEMNGLELLNKIKERSPDAAVVMITAYGSIETAIEAMKQGAFDYILKPFPTVKIIEIIEKISGENSNENRADFPDIITSDSKMLEILDMVDTVGKSDATVLISGESGTGKELIARAIHNHSKRKSEAFVAINCAAMPQDLLESELFGHEKGSFTGAIARKSGKFELADGGTLLLDEVSELPMSLQAKLLRALQEREIDRIGGREPVKLDVRIISTTNEELENRVKEGKFREDLFYRLCVIPIELPPLRERRGDIALLAKYFFREFCRQNKKSITNISQSAVDKLSQQQWPGNVRQLRNVMERAIILCKDRILMPHHLFPEDIEEDASPQISLEVGASLYEAEKQLILKTLQEVGGNKSKAAKILGLTAKTIRNKLRQYQVAGSNPA